MKTRTLIHIVVRCCHKKIISCCCLGDFISVIKLEFVLKDSGLIAEDSRSNLFLTDAGGSVARLLLFIDDVIGNAGCRS